MGLGLENQVMQAEVRALPRGGGMRGALILSLLPSTLLPYTLLPYTQLTGAALAEVIAVPSGQVVELEEVIADDAGGAMRFRFVAPGIGRAGGSVDFDTAIVDMDHLCQSYALPRLDPGVGPGAQVIVSLSDIPVPFGEITPEATQFFEAYEIVAGICVGEAF